MTERLTASSVPVRASGEPQKLIDAFRREVQDKLGVVFNGYRSSPLDRVVHRKQCEDFLVDLFAEGIKASASPSDDGARQPQEDFTRQFFRKLRSFDWLSAPEAILEEDGDIGCDWFVNGGTVSAHVSANGRAGWAALVGEHKSHGTFQLPDWSETFTESLRLLQSRAQADDGAARPQPAQEELPSPMPSFDARVWAESFVAHVKRHPGIPTDEGTMLGWFASALMRGFDEGKRLSSPSVADSPTCQREIMRSADDSAAYLSVKCTCGKCPSSPAGR